MSMSRRFGSLVMPRAGFTLCRTPQITSRPFASSPPSENKELEEKVATLQATWQTLLDRSDLKLLDQAKKDSLHALWQEWSLIAAEAGELLGRQVQLKSLPFLASKDRS
eukprot:gb/GEZN01019181.1/.p2 GENE.gb/GEZN01019181.1/~~gb/GEZN01019181.1/.p2  ORF type:complete len:109 (+),score=18.47 gb/GEZN01019181.1/:108-434(+)